jgi:hypothetical protein
VYRFLDSFFLFHLVGFFKGQTLKKEKPMKKAIVVVLFCLVFWLVAGASASELSTIDSGICSGVVNHAAVGVGDVFSKDVGTLFCFTRVLGPYLEGNDQYVEHVWYYGETERARVTLPVKSSSWGTYSSKIIQAFEIGEWRVEVLDPQGEPINVFQFVITE